MLRPSRYARSQFLTPVEVPSGDEDYLDPLSSEFIGLEDSLRGRQVRAITVTAETAGAPDLISFNEYGREDYWWIIALVNGITDPVTEIAPGRTLALPLQRDVEQFLIDRRRLSSNRRRSVVLR